MLNTSSQAPTSLAIWDTLVQHQQDCARENMRDYFLNDPNRFNIFSISVSGILLDYSKNLITAKTRALLCDLAIAQHVPEKIAALFAGEFVNTTERRAALHPFMRALSPKAADNEHDAVTHARIIYQRMEKLCDAITKQTFLGATGKPITDVVNLGIGGSHWGAACAYAALADYHAPHVRCHFVADLDPNDFYTAVKSLSPETTLFIISSKSFTTTETLFNAELAKDWLKQKLTHAEYHHHFIGITAQPERAEKFGIARDNIFTIDNSIGGRYSVWSAMGLPLMIGIGTENFEAFLQGAREIDTHVRTTPLAENMPVMLALLSIWYINFFHAQTHAILPYAHPLNLLLPYIQQLEMESNGKTRRHNGDATEYATGAVVWGGVGIHGQHTFNQMLHQGHHLIPVDFILPIYNSSATQEQQAQLIAQCLGQARALMWGKTASECGAENELTTHQVLAGNHPSNILLIEKISPLTLGALFALYEHKVFVQAAIWDINPFDQWGVEHGKEIAQSLLQALRDPSIAINEHDASTAALIQYCR